MLDPQMKMEDRAPVPMEDGARPRPSAVPRRAALIVNRSSGQGDALFEAMRHQAGEAGIELVSAQAIGEPEAMRAAVRAAIAGGVPMILLGGGDGTISRLIGEFAGTDCVCAPLPLGTANSFARSIGLGPDPDAAIATIARGRVRAVDIGLIDGIAFANSAAIGLSPKIGETIPRSLKRWLGPLAYPLWAVRCLVAFRPFRLVLRHAEGERRVWASEVRILNGAYHAGIRLSDDAGTDSGDIAIQIVTGRSLRHLLRDWYVRFLGLPMQADHVETFRGREFRLETRPRRRISVDGDVQGFTPVTIGIAPASVHVVAPRQG